jgi:DNA (cytosine-5)-methyltransferase 1
MFRVLSLFAGIGGFDLGLERTGGFRTVALCERDAAAQRVLKKHWPEVPIYDDVCTLTGEQLAADGIAVDVICGGFPCQDISTAGAGAGIEGERSGLWSEYARLIGELRPAYVIVENVSALLSRGLDKVLGDLAALGYDADWHCIPASAVGAPHRRDRIWIIAYPNHVLHSGELDGGTVSRAATGSEAGYRGEGQAPHGKRLRPQSRPSRKVVADTPLMQCDGSNDNARKRVGGRALSKSRNSGGAVALADALGFRQSRQGQPFPAGHPAADGEGEANHAFHVRLSQQWAVEPPVGRVADGVPGRVDRLKQLGNAVVPQIPELIGRAILEAEAA